MLFREGEGRGERGGNVQSAMTTLEVLRIWRHCACEVMWTVPLIFAAGDLVGSRDCSV